MSAQNTDPVKSAMEAYAGPYNCAQAVAFAFRHVSGLTDADVADHKRNGGGRAPEGHCGALHAALQVLPEEPRRADLLEQFKARVGSVCCRDIRAAKVTPCAACVQTAATLLRDALDATAAK